MSRPDNAIRLAIARQRYNPYGGAERFVARALDALAEENMVSISLLARDWPSAAESPTHWQWRRLDPFYLGRTWRDYSFMRAVQNIRGDYTLLQSHERIPGAAIFRARDGSNTPKRNIHFSVLSRVLRLTIVLSAPWNAGCSRILRCVA